MEGDPFVGAKACPYSACPAFLEKEYHRPCVAEGEASPFAVAEASPCLVVAETECHLAVEAAYHSFAGVKACPLAAVAASSFYLPATAGLNQVAAAVAASSFYHPAMGEPTLATEAAPFPAVANSEGAVVISIASEAKAALLARASLVW